MSKFKKAVSLGLILTMILTACAFSVNVSAEETVELNEYDYVVSEKLEALEVVDVVENERLTDFVLRGDIINILTKYLHIDGVSVEGETTPFIDVSIYDENIGAYRALKQMGHIAGDENKRFRPDDYLTYNEAIKLVVSAMGYKPFAERNGGYPTGYLYTANKYGLLTAIRGSGSNPIPFCDLYRIMEASLYADAVVYRYAINEDDSSFAFDENRTVLEETHGYTFVSGVVTGNEDTRITMQDSSKVDRYQIEIEGKVYDTPGKEYANLLGRYAHGYAKKDEFGNLDIIYLEKDAKNYEIKISADDILIAKTTDTKIYYEDENEEEKYISAMLGLPLIHNGKKASYMTLKQAMPEGGYIVGVDNTGDKVIDVLFVYEYENYVVDVIDTYSKKIHDEYDPNKILKLDSFDDEIRIYNENGETMAFSDIALGDVLSVMESKNTSDYKIITVYVIRSSIQGAVSEIVEDKYLIDGTYYELAESLKEHIKNGNADPVSLGAQSTFYLDYDGKIAYYTREVTTDAKYGVLAAVGSQSGMENYIKVKVFTQDSKWLETDLTETVKIDGINRKISKNDGFSAAKTALENAQGQVILFKTDANDNITNIDTASTTGKEGELVEVLRGRNFTIRWGIINAVKYDKDSDGVDDDTDGDDFPVWTQISAKAGTFIVFKTPKLEDMLTDTENWAVETTMPSQDDYRVGSKLNDYVLYNLGRDGIPHATCIMLRGSNAKSASIVTSSNYVFVTNQTEGIDEDGNTAIKLYYSSQGTELSCFVRQRVDYREEAIRGQTNTSTDAVNKPFADVNLRTGDIIQFGTDSDGYISSINVIYRTDRTSPNATNAAIPEIPFNNTSSGNYSGAVAGKVDKVDATQNLISIKTVDPSDSTVEALQVMNATNNITIYQKTIGKTIGGTLADIIPGDNIIVKVAGGFASSASQIVVIR